MRMKENARCHHRRSRFTLVHVAPPSSDRKRPPSFASTIAYRRRLSPPATAIVIFPRTSDFGSPGFFVSSFHVVPPSVDLKRPLPGPPSDKEYGVRNASHSAA